MKNPPKEFKEKLDAVYAERNQCVAALAFMAVKAGIKAGIGRDASESCEDEWRNVVYIDLPTGQVSWHFHESEMKLLYGLPDYETEYDGHSTEEKYERLNKFC